MTGILLAGGKAGRAPRARLAGAVAPGLLLAMTACLLAGCSSDSMELPSLPKVGDLNPFKEKQVPLPGKRVAIMQAPDKLPGDLAEASKPIALPSAVTNESWSQPGGVASNAPGHLALNGAVRVTWRTSAGQGTSKDGRLTASPIVYGGRIFTLDTNADVHAYASTGGSAVWHAKLMPETGISPTSGNTTLPFSPTRTSVARSGWP